MMGRRHLSGFHIHILFKECVPQFFCQILVCGAQRRSAVKAALKKAVLVSEYAQIYGQGS